MIKESHFIAKIRGTIVVKRLVQYLIGMMSNFIYKHLHLYVLFLKMIYFSVVLQLWDIRDGMCKQTFSGHESDINAIVVSIFISNSFTLPAKLF